MVTRRYTRISLVLALVGATALPCAHGKPKTATVRGRVLEFTGRPLGKVQLWLFSEPDSKRRFYTRTRSDGSFLFERVPTGNYWLSVVRINRADDFIAEHILIAPGDVWELNYNLQHRSVRLCNSTRGILRKFKYHGGTPDQLAGGTWTEFR
jgi:hypothetical protein